ncbi:hypothetical protein ASD83_00700 [Devosia sp. Root685]|uniref:hypothetical protein n=1 Tax=Devosia sp. Root685 TaxID=1736587 RepID=UPI0006FAE3D9|nr:hypothetical protein [Devosia sp. Root685]KRA99093.1 hypothetical protein ASD83_00700 [Devosia sp. Root685]
MEPVAHPEIFPHIRIVMGTVVGLGITRLLMTFAGMVQHPDRPGRSYLHLLWMGSILLELILFWWWEFSLFQLANWTFGIAFFIITYAVTLFMMAALLCPDNISEYKGYEDFFLRRRPWFFGLLATTFVLDTVDTIIKGGTHLARFDLSYFIQVPVGLVLCVIAWRSSDRRVHLFVVGLHIVYQFYLIARFFNTTH